MSEIRFLQPLAGDLLIEGADGEMREGRFYAQVRVRADAGSLCINGVRAERDEQGVFCARVPLDALRPGQHGTVAQLRLQGALLQRLLDLGLTEDCPISCRLRAPAGDPAAYGIRGAVIALRSADAAGILVRLEGTPWPDETARRISPSP